MQRKTSPSRQEDGPVSEDLIGLWKREFPDEDTLPVEITLQLKHLAALEQLVLQEVLRPFGIGAGDVDALLLMSQQPPPHRLRPIDLAQLCMVTTGAITGRLERLRTHGYVTRIQSETDKRTIYVQLTAKGRAAGQQIRRSLHADSIFLQAIRRLPLNERGHMRGLLARLISLVGQEIAASSMEVADRRRRGREEPAARATAERRRARPAGRPSST